MIKPILTFITILFLSLQAFGFEYRVACGSVDTQPSSTKPALLLVGGAESNSPAEKIATRWLLEQAPTGDYLVLRVGGTGSQAQWVCDQFSDSVHSAAELSVDSRADANHAALVNTVRHAEIIFIAGGDQNKYEDLWKNTALANALNEHVRSKPIGGTSAGMVILGESYYAPSKKAVIGSEILNNPFHKKGSDIFHGDFILHPLLKNTLNETHLDRRLSQQTRHSRLFGFLARTVVDHQLHQNRYAIGLDEATFLAVDEQGLGKVYGKRAYFLQSNGTYPERSLPNESLRWDHQKKAVEVYIIQGSARGNGFVDLNTWRNFSGGEQQYWYTDSGFRGFNCPRGCQQAGDQTLSP